MSTPSYLEYYLQRWSLTEPHLLTATATSHIYTVRYQGETVILKRLNAVGVADESGGAVALDYWQGQGAVRLLQHDDGAHLLEYAGGDDLLPLVDRGADSEATGIIAGVLNQLHSAPAPLPAVGLTPLPRWFRSLFKCAESEGASPVYQRGAQVAAGLLAAPQQVRVLHGDIHHQNIRHKVGRGWLAFDPKGLIGERTYDAANTLCNPPDRPQIVLDENRLLTQAALLAKTTHLDEGRLLAYTFAYACLSAAWSVEDDADPTDALIIAGLLEPHVVR